MTIEAVKAVLWFLAGIGLFFAGLRVMTISLQGAAGPAVERSLARLTQHQAGAFFTGCLVTAVLQSSSAVTVMTVGLVEAGVLNMVQAVGITLGSNLGTTLAPQIFAFPPGALLGPAFLLMVGLALFLRWRGGEVWQKIGEGVAGFVLLLMGLEVMADAARAWGDKAPLHQLMTQLSSSVPLGVGVGALVTALVHSSGLVMALIISLGRDGLVGLPAAINLMLGSNIGTCFTTLLAGLGSSRRGKKASLANLIINVAGVVAILPFLPLFIRLVESTAQFLPRQIANAHTLFNLLSAVVGYPFIRPLGEWLARWGEELEE